MKTSLKEIIEQYPSYPIIPTLTSNIIEYHAVKTDNSSKNHSDTDVDLEKRISLVDLFLHPLSKDDLFLKHLHQYFIQPDQYKGITDLFSNGHTEHRNTPVIYYPDKHPTLLGLGLLFSYHAQIYHYLAQPLIASDPEDIIQFAKLISDNSIPVGFHVSVIYQECMDCITHHKTAFKFYKNKTDKISILHIDTVQKTYFSTAFLSILFKNIPTENLIKFDFYVSGISDKFYLQTDTTHCSTFTRKLLKDIDWEFRQHFDDSNEDHLTSFQSWKFTQLDIAAQANEIWGNNDQPHGGIPEFLDKFENVYNYHLPIYLYRGTQRPKILEKVHNTFEFENLNVSNDDVPMGISDHYETDDTDFLDSQLTERAYHKVGHARTFHPHHSYINWFAMKDEMIINYLVNELSPELLLKQTNTYFIRNWDLSRFISTFSNQSNNPPQPADPYENFVILISSMANMTVGKYNDIDFIERSKTQRFHLAYMTKFFSSINMQEKNIIVTSELASELDTFLDMYRMKFPEVQETIYKIKRMYQSAIKRSPLIEEKEALRPVICVLNSKTDEIISNLMIHSTASILLNMFKTNGAHQEAIEDNEYTLPEQQEFSDEELQRIRHIIG